MKTLLFNPFMACCFSGYREEKFRFPLTDGCKQFQKLKEDLVYAIETSVITGRSIFITGLAYGFDLIAAETVLEMKKSSPYSNLLLLGAIPFAKQTDEKGWTKEWKSRYRAVASACAEVYNVSGEKENRRGLYMMRNRYMVDNSRMLICYHDGLPGGTKNTIAYAHSKARIVINVAQ